jgi:hypothetical protein
LIECRAHLSFILRKRFTTLNSFWAISFRAPILSIGRLRTNYPSATKRDRSKHDIREEKSSASSKIEFDRVSPGTSEFANASPSHLWIALSLLDDV